MHIWAFIAVICIRIVCCTYHIYLLSVTIGSFRKTDIKGYVRMKNKVAFPIVTTPDIIATDLLIGQIQRLPPSMSDGLTGRVFLPPSPSSEPFHRRHPALLNCRSSTPTSFLFNPFYLFPISAYRRMTITRGNTPGTKELLLASFFLSVSPASRPAFISSCLLACLPIFLP